jgi:hypothetical protein
LGQVDRGPTDARDRIDVDAGGIDHQPLRAADRQQEFKDMSARLERIEGMLERLQPGPVHARQDADVRHEVGGRVS